MAFNTSPLESLSSQQEPDSKLFSHEFLDDHIDSESHMLDSGLISPTNTDRKDSIAASSVSILSPQSTATDWNEFPVPSNLFLTDRQLYTASPFSESALSVINTNGFQGQISQNMYSSGVSSPVTDNIRPSLVPGNISVTTIPSKSAMSLADQEVELQRLNRHMRNNSPQRALADLRRDGVRKKNARFEIPIDRNLKNIDELIAGAPTEELAKELKQQKRLLRNRQAALDSRQRKKKHTEDLEKEQKYWQDKNRGLEDQIKEMREQFDKVLLDNQNLNHHVANLHHEVATVKNEKEEIIMKHTLETTNLRKKISVLKDQLEHGAPPQQHEFHFGNELDPLSMNPDGDWSNWMSDFSEMEESKSVSQSETTLVVGQRRKDTLLPDITDKQVVSSSFLFLFLLYGAFVATRATSTTTVPAMAPEFRAEAETILNQVLQDNTAAQNPAMAMPQLNDIQTVASWFQPSSTQVQQPQFSPRGNGNMASSLDALTNQVLTPSKQQEAEEAFSLTPAQYNSLTSMDFQRSSYQTPMPQPAKPRNTPLQELLKARREANRPETVSEVYTRSLMWDRVSPEVIEQFKRLVSSNDMRDDTDVK